MNNIEAGNKITPTHIKPGFLVSGKVSKIYENGIEITFLGGLIGTCFTDHLEESTGIGKYKIGQKVISRIISVDPVSKTISTSMKNNIVNWSNKIEASLSKL